MAVAISQKTRRIWLDMHRVQRHFPSSFSINAWGLISFMMCGRLEMPNQSSYTYIEFYWLSPHPLQLHILAPF
jgi:hypothetical protein